MENEGEARGGGEMWGERGEVEQGCAGERGEMEGGWGGGRGER